MGIAALGRTFNLVGWPAFFLIGNALFGLIFLFIIATTCRRRRRFFIIEI